MPDVLFSMDDNRYDISDYYQVDPMFGTNDDMDRLLLRQKKSEV